MLRLELPDRRKKRFMDVGKVKKVVMEADDSLWRPLNSPKEKTKMDKHDQHALSQSNK